MNSHTPITDAAASTTMFIDGEPVVEIKICRDLKRELQKAQAETAAMREALEDFKTECRDCGGVGWYAVCQDAPEQIQCQRCHGVQFALSADAGSELLAELKRLRAQHEFSDGQAAYYARLCDTKDAELNSLRDELKSAREEVERAKADRNRAGVEERRKYLPKIQELTGELAKANADVLLHSGLRVELTNILGLESLTPRTREGNSALVERVDGLKSELAKAQAQCAELRSEVGKAFREGYCNGYGSDTLGDHGSEDFNLSYNQSRTKKVTEGKL